MSVLAGGTTRLACQVGGHPGLMITQDGSLLIKPALPKEVAFYQAIASDPGLSLLRPFVSDFYGILRLEGQLAAGGGSIVLENLSYTFSKPNIIDIKLGTVLYDDDASPAKRARMEKAARDTTSAETGMRLTGCQVYNLATNKPVMVDRAYGKSLKPSDLLDGIVRFFPLASNTAPCLSAFADLSSDQATNSGTGLPSEILQDMLSQIRLEIEEIYTAVAGTEMRMVGGSLLILYEAEWERASEGLQILKEQQEESDSYNRDEEDNGDNDEDNNDEDNNDEDNNDEDNNDEDSDGGGDENSDEDNDEGNEKPIGPPFVVKLIDFAHTQLAPGHGPDEGVLLGLRTVLRLLDDRLQQVKGLSGRQ
ncbi:uncharacterized protein FIBRA_06745 [Fibroporia radiculosa]|uniref:Kinase n=1 Tax=Fibroporia radiculosa TaxID=599839 RepID=J4H487_9APHY|nr:uncharacterized protein FIBRA_06745 [Fibroporia radiculosa]CCM04564.1 predicted protein [Fibroporia radiculosa]